VVADSANVSWTFAGCPTPPDWRFDWGALLAGLPWLRALEGVPQNPAYHAEGDVLIHTHMPDMPAISLDTIRAARRVAPEASQGAVVATAKEQARALLRAKLPFTWNATNLTRQLRDPLIDLFLSYGARVRIVYCDASIEPVLRRNRARPRPVPEQVIRRLAGKLDLPDLTEAHGVDYVGE
jgi:predicted kinase